MTNPSITDCSGLTGTPQSIFQPCNVGELQAYLRSQPNPSLRIGGGRTGVSGGAVPDAHETYIDLSRCNGISWYDKGGGVIIAEAGVTMQSLQDEVSSEGWQFPVIPGSKDKATVGGMIACNGGGPLSLKYGKMAQWVLGVEIMQPNGETHQLGSYCTKVSEGCDWKSLIIGAEGTLGIITHAILKCAPALPALHYQRFASDDFFQLFELIPNLVKADSYLIEIAEQQALQFSSKVSENVLWAALPSAWSGSLPKGVRSTEAKVSDLAERFDIGYGLQGYKAFLDLDVCFPLKHAAIALHELQDWLDGNGFEHVIFGHAGDGNYHIHLFFNGDEEKWRAKTPEFDAKVRQYDGHLSGEHGIGKIHRNRFERSTDSLESSAYQALKKILDPGKRLPELP